MRNLEGEKKQWEARKKHNALTDPVEKAKFLTQFSEASPEQSLASYYVVRTDYTRIKKEKNLPIVSSKPQSHQSNQAVG